MLGTGVDKDREILTYCTGGIRCEKANAYLIQQLGYTNVAALKGGIVNYAQYAAQQGLESTFLGVNHVFDQRLGQRVGGQILSRCINCGSSSDVQTDCLNTHCPRPFARRRYVQCEECAVRKHGCCSAACGDEMQCRARVQEQGSALERLRIDIRAARRKQQQRDRTRADLAAKAAVAGRDAPSGEASEQEVEEVEALSELEARELDAQGRLEYPSPLLGQCANVLCRPRGAIVEGPGTAGQRGSQPSQC